jgi:hypothetical protein
MSMHDRSTTKGAVPFRANVRESSPWDCIPGVVPVQEVGKRRARNKAARKSRRNNR